MSDNIYRDAIEVLAERGWIKGYLQNDKGQVCLLGALSIAQNGSQRYPETYRLYRDGVVSIVDRIALEQFGDRPDRRVGYTATLTDAVGFNDADETTIDDVILVLEKAAVAHDEQI